MFLLFICFMCVCVCIGQRTTCGRHFSPSTMWVLRTKLKSLGLTATTFTHCAISMAP